MTRKRFPRQCEKVQIRNDGTAVLGCRDRDGDPIVHCGNAPDYRDSALPLAEQLCLRALEEHDPHMNDPYKRPYVEVCHNLDETMADPDKAGSAENLQLRFAGMERNLRQMIEDPELSNGDNGRYLYHIDARIIHAFLPAFWFRAEHGLNEPVPNTIVKDVYEKIAALLNDFSDLYDGVAKQVALRRTEVEIIAFLLRTRRSEFFPYPTVFREDASESREFNHDVYVPYKDKKIVIQVTNADYRLKNGKKKSEGYDPQMIIAIHQNLVNLDYQEGETIVTKFEGEPVVIEHEHDIPDDYEHFAEEQPRYIAWGAVSNGDNDDLHLVTEYVQEIGGTRRDGLVSSLIKEARGERIDTNELNALNGASHYLMALIREKQRKIDS